MISEADISKLYKLMAENPKKYKDIINNEYKVRMAMRNWPLVRAMESKLADIPPVKAGEKFENKTSRGKKIQVKVVDLNVETTLISATEEKVNTEIKNKSVKSVGLNMVDSNARHRIDNLKKAIAGEVVSTAHAVERINIIEMAGRDMNDAVKIATQGKSSSGKTKLSSLFNRIEFGHHLDELNSKLMKLPQV